MSTAQVAADLLALANQAAAEEARAKAEEEARVKAELQPLVDLANAMLAAWQARGASDDEALRMLREWVPRVLAAADW